MNTNSEVAGARNSVVIGGLVIATGVLFLLLGYYAGSSRKFAHLEAELAEYKAAEKLKLPEALAEIDAASARLRQRLAKVQSLDECEAKLKDALQELGKCRRENDELRFKLQIADRLVPHSEMFFLEEGQSAIFGKFGVIVGLTDVSHYDLKATLMVNNLKHEIGPGQFVPVRSGNQDCKIVFWKVVRNSGIPIKYTAELLFLVEGGGGQPILPDSRQMDRAGGEKT